MILKRLSTAFALVFALTGLAAAQVPDCRTQANPTGAHICRAFSYLYLPKNANSGVHVSGLRGAYIKSITTAGLATVQLADGTESTVQLALAGGTTLTQEQVEDYVGGMVTRGTKTGITVTYVDDGGNEGQINFTVAGGGSVTISDDPAADITTGASAAGSTGEVSDAGHVHGNAAKVHTMSVSATQDGTDERIFVLSNLQPPLTTPAIGTTVVWKTPTTLVSTGNTGVVLQINGVNYNFIRPPNHAISSSVLDANTPYIGVYDGTNFELISTTLGIPSGGTNNQVLKKTANADYAVAWEDESGGGLTQADVDNRFTTLRPPIFTATARATVSDNVFSFTPMPDAINPTHGLTIIFATPVTIASHDDQAAVSWNGANRSIFFPGRPTTRVQDFKTNATYVAVWDGSAFQVADNNVLADWNATTGDARILNKPTVITAAERTKLTGIETDATADQSAAEVPVDATGFDGNLATTDTNMQLVAQKMDDLTTAGVSQEIVEDYAGEMAARGTQSEITVTYVDDGGNPGQLNFDVETVGVNTIPHVASIPDVTDASPDLVFLSHDEIGGDREDADMVMGEELGRYCGYSNGSVFDVFGSISKSSPVLAVFGIWDGSDCTLSEVFSANEGFLDELNRVVLTISGTESTCNLGERDPHFGVYVKRIVSCTAAEDLSLGTIQINFLRPDGAAYFTDGTVVNPRGLYEKVGTPPAYHDIRPIEESHRLGTGTAACGNDDPPTDGGQVCIDSDGGGYFSTDRVLIVTTEGTIDEVATFTSDYWNGAQALTDFSDNGTEGEFIWHPTSDAFIQLQDDTLEFATWAQIWTHIADIDEGIVLSLTVTAGGQDYNITAPTVSITGGGCTTAPTATATINGGQVTALTLTNRGSGCTGNPSVALIGGDGQGATASALAHPADTAEEQTAQDALRDDSIYLGDFVSRDGAAAERDGYTDATKTYYYNLNQHPDDIYRIVTFTDGAETESAQHVWNGPALVRHDFFGLLDSVFIFPESDGHLRAPTAEDYDTDTAQSLVVGFDGSWWKVGRSLEPGHASAATFVEVRENQTVSFGGVAYRYRGEHSADGYFHNPQVNDFYYNLSTHRLRIYLDHSRFLEPNAWSDLSPSGNLGRHLNFIGLFADEADALAHVTAVGQHVIYGIGSGAHSLFHVTSYTAAEASFYRYFWRPVFPVALLPVNVALVDDATYTWQGANMPGQEVQFSRRLAPAELGQAVLVDWRAYATTDPGDAYRNPGAVVLSDRIEALTDEAPLPLNKQNPGGGREPIDHTVAITESRVTGAVTFKFPRQAAGNPLSDMRLIYIGDHIDDVDESLDSSDTQITVDSTTGMVAQQDYWIAGPVDGGGCSITYHREKVTITARDDAANISVTRGVDNTGLDSNCTYSPGADVIEDDKATFVLVPSHADQDRAIMSFTLLAQGAGGSGGGGEDVAVWAIDGNDIQIPAGKIPAGTCRTVADLDPGIGTSNAWRRILWQFDLNENLLNADGEFLEIEVRSPSGLSIVSVPLQAWKDLGASTLTTRATPPDNTGTNTTGTAQNAARLDGTTPLTFNWAAAEGTVPTLASQGIAFYDVGRVTDGTKMLISHGDVGLTPDNVKVEACD